ncbi:ABC transporter substrate-binding protein [Kineococcus gynurae]|uniref:peptide ABC transporter substrate-binding protein n=1 Tax=Kineococcus gynurae TaxID=452979 RepID=UPI0035ED314C
MGLAGAGALWTLSACGGGDDGDGSGEGGSSTPITVWGGEPQNPLIPTNTNETGGGKILDCVFAGLVAYEADGTPVNDVAESIESPDATTYTIKLKADQKFSDGSPVTADSFVKAWNYGALSTNAQLSSYFFEPIEGYDAVSAETPTAQELSGLVVVDETTFTVKLNAPEGDFPLRLGYSAYYPLPESAFEDIAAFGENPVGNGPYKLEAEGAWRHNEGINLVVNDQYAGPRKPVNAGVNIVFYADLDTAYSALQSGELDVLDQVPDSALTTFTSDLGDRAVNQPSAVFQGFVIPTALAGFTGEAGQLRRQAIAYAINRADICKVVFNDTRTPAKDYSSPVVPYWTEDVPGNEVCTYDADKAKELWAQAEAIEPYTGTFTIAYNTDGGHATWVDAVTAGLRQTLGMNAEGKPYATFAQLRSDITGGTINGAFRSGWQADYPSMYNFLASTFATGGGSNDGKYSNPQYDALLAQASANTDAEAAVATLVQAQTILMTDLPSIPLWYSNAAGGYADTVSDVKFGWNSVPIYETITKA